MRSEVRTDEKHNVGQIMLNWRKLFNRMCGEEFPTSFFAYDVESSGFSREKDLILEWGHCLVHDMKIVNKMSVLLNWYAVDTVPHDWLDSQLNRIARAMEISGRPWHINKQRLQDEGVDPKKGLQFVYDMIIEADAQKLFLVTHNGWSFDCPMLVSHFAQDLGVDYTFNPNRCLDTGCIEKASQLLVTKENAFPEPTETLGDYFKRIRAWRAKDVLYNLDTHCYQKYGFDKYVNADDLHAAEDDSYLLYLLMCEYKKLFDAAKVEAGPTVLTAPAARPALIKPSVRPAPQTPAGGVPNYRKQRNR